MDALQEVKTYLEELGTFVRSLDKRSPIQVRIRVKHLTDSLGNALSKMFSDPSILSREDFRRKMIELINRFKNILHFFPSSQEYLEPKFMVGAVTNFCITQFMAMAIEDETFLSGFATLLADILTGIPDPFEQDSILLKTNKNLFLKVLETSGDIYFFAVTKAYFVPEPQYLEWIKLALLYYRTLLNHMEDEGLEFNFKEPTKIYQSFATFISIYIYYTELILSALSVLGTQSEFLPPPEQIDQEFSQIIDRLESYRNMLLSAFRIGQIGKNDNPEQNMHFTIADLGLQYLKFQFSRFSTFLEWQEGNEAPLNNLLEMATEMLSIFQKFHQNAGIPFTHSPFSAAIENLAIDILGLISEFKSDHANETISQLLQIFTDETLDKFYNLHYAIALALARTDPVQAHGHFEKLMKTPNIVITETLPVQIGYYLTGVAIDKIPLDRAKSELKNIVNQLKQLNNPALTSKLTKEINEMPERSSQPPFNSFDIWTWFQPKTKTFSWYPFNTARGTCIGDFQ